MRLAYVKLLRRCLVGLIVVVLAAVALNWVHTWRTRARSVLRTTEILSSEMMRSADSIEYSENENGVARFKLHAERLLETRQGKSLLQGTEAYDFNPDGSVRNQIQSRKAEYDRDQRKADFREDVRIHMGQGVELRTEALSYDLRSNIGQTDNGLQFRSEQASGTAQSARYDSARKIIDLKGNLDFNLKRPLAAPDGTHREETIRITSQQGFYSESDQLIVFRGNAHLDSDSASLAGNEIEARFTPDRKRLTALVCQGNAVYDSKEPGDARNLRGDRIDFRIVDPPGALERIDVFGNAGFSSQSDAGRQELHGSQIHVQLDVERGLPTRIESNFAVRFVLERGTESTVATGDQLEAGFASGSNMLEHVHVWGGTHMSMLGPQGGEGDELKAEDIKIRFGVQEGRSVPQELQAERSVQWTAAPQKDAKGRETQAGRTLTAAALTMRYNQSGDALESGHASGNVVLEGLQAPSAGGAQLRRLQADTVRFGFYPRQNRLREFSGDGNVRVFYRRPPDPQTDSAAQDFETSSASIRGTFNEQDGAAQTLSQWGGFTYRDGGRTATSGRSDYEASRDLLVLRDSPKITDANASTTGELMEYDQKNRILTVRRHVRSVLGARDNAPTPFSSSSGSSSPSVVTAALMQYWTDDARARYSDNVQMLSESGQLQSQQLEIANGGERVLAQGGVRHLLLRRQEPPPAGSPQAKSTAPAKPAASRTQPVTIRSARLDYQKQQNAIHYSGDVTLQTSDIWMSSDTIDAVFDSTGRSIDHATARGKLLVRQAGREVRGEQADYFLDPGKFVVVGNLAQIQDPQRGVSHARRLTFFTSDDRILLESK